jgi:hypothetical protein
VTEFCELRIAQAYWAHRERKDGRSSPQEVLGWLSGVRYLPEDLERAFFSTRFTRKLDTLGETGWLKALKLEGYAPCHPRGSLALQEALFAYLDALA